MNFQTKKRRIIKKLIIIAVTATIIATTSFAYVIEPGLVEYVAETKTFDSLIISGTLFCANYDPVVPGSKLDITIIITNGDFILCQGGSITCFSTISFYFTADSCWVSI